MCICKCIVQFMRHAFGSRGIFVPVCIAEFCVFILTLYCVLQEKITSTTNGTSYIMVLVLIPIHGNSGLNSLFLKTKMWKRIRSILAQVPSLDSAASITPQTGIFQLEAKLMKFARSYRNYMIGSCLYRGFRPIKTTCFNDG